MGNIEHSTSNVECLFDVECFPHVRDWTFDFLVWCDVCELNQ